MVNDEVHLHGCAALRCPAHCSVGCLTGHMWWLYSLMHVTVLHRVRAAEPRLHRLPRAPTQVVVPVGACITCRDGSPALQEHKRAGWTFDKKHEFIKWNTKWYTLWSVTHTVCFDHSALVFLIQGWDSAYAEAWLQCMRILDSWLGGRHPSPLSCPRVSCLHCKNRPRLFS